MHTRASGLFTALKEGGAKGATNAARHHVRRGLVMAEVALAVMLVIWPGLLLRTASTTSPRSMAGSIGRGSSRSRCHHQATSTAARGSRRTSDCSRSCERRPACRRPR